MPRSGTSRKEFIRTHRIMLGREPSEEEFEAHLAEGQTLAALVGALARSDEHADNLANPPKPAWRGALAGSAAASKLIPPGTVSSDERAIVGNDGCVFIYRGTNTTFHQFEGKMPLEPAALEHWGAVLETRASGAAKVGAKLVCLVVPDKLAVVADAFPMQLEPVGPRPVEQLQEAFPGQFLYPADTLLTAGNVADVTYRTDSHLSLYGAQVVYGTVMRRFGLPPAATAIDCDYREVMRSSALGKGFSPSLYDVQDIPTRIAGAAVESNENEVRLHRGVIRVSRNPAAEQRAKIVVIGDSYCFPWRSGQLGCLIERSFSEAHFLWTAMGWDSDYIDRVQPDYILLETAERFMIRPPELNSSIEALAAKAIRARRPKVAPLPGSAIDFAAKSRTVADLLSGYRSRVDTTIGEGDAMFQGDLDDYLSVSYSAVAQIAHAMGVSGRTSFPRILDFACGHGRVLRALRAAFPEAELTACDIDRGGVEFCASQFGAVPTYSDPDPARVSLDGSFDLIWVGSLLTHLDAEGCRAFLDLLRRHLADDGLLIFSSHGRNAIKRWPRDDERAQAIVDGFDREGFGYRDHPGVQGYGTTAFSAAWIADVLSAWTDLMLVGYVERGLADHQDVIAVLKTDVHHAQGDLLLG